MRISLSNASTTRRETKRRSIQLKEETQFAWSHTFPPSTLNSIPNLLELTMGLMRLSISSNTAWLSFGAKIEIFPMVEHTTSNELQV